MPENTDIQQLDLTSPDAWRALPAVVESMVRDEDAASALLLWGRIQGLPQRETIERALAPLLPTIVWLALPLVLESEIAPLVDRYVVPLLDRGDNALTERLDLTLMGVALDQRDVLKQRVVERLRQNSAPLTSSALALSATETQSPTVANWVAALAAHTAQGPDDFLDSRPNASQISVADRQRVHRLASALALLVAPSTTTSGFLEAISVRQSDGSLAVMQRGEISPTGRAAVSAPSTSVVPPAPPPTRTPPSSDGLGINAEDHPELTAHTERVTAMEPPPATADVVDLLVQALPPEQRIAFPDPVLDRRFHTAITVFLKGLRGADETRELLVRPAKIGGLALTAPVADTIMKTFTPHVTTLQETDGHARLQAEQAAMVAAQPPPPMVPVMPPPLPPRPMPTAPAPAPAPTAPPPVFQAKRLTPNYRARPVETDARRVSDIRTKITPGGTPTRTVGPVDELRSLTLDEFHTFGQSAVSAAQRLKEKFDALGKESYALRVQGATAYRQSPLYQLYLALGNESLLAGQPVDAAITARTASQQPTLSADEFMALSDLNRSLRL